jgi:RecG-like helicase
VSGLAHANVTFVPYQVGAASHTIELDALIEAASAAKRSGRHDKREARAALLSQEPIVKAAEVPEGVTPIANVSYRERARVAGRVRSLRVQPWSGVATLECSLVDNTGGIALVFLGRKHVAGLAPGVRVVAEGMVGDHGGRLAILNPNYRILPSGDEDVEKPATHH